MRRDWLTLAPEGCPRLPRYRSESSCCPTGRAVSVRTESSSPGEGHVVSVIRAGQEGADRAKPARQGLGPAGHWRPSPWRTPGIARSSRVLKKLEIVILCENSELLNMGQ